MIATPPRMPTIGMRGPKFILSSSSLTLSELLDFAGERTVLGGDIALYVAEPAVDVLEPKPNVAGGASRGLADRTPECVFLHVRGFKLARPVGRQQAGTEIDLQTRAGAQEVRRVPADPDQRAVEPCVVRAGTNYLPPSRAS